MICLEGLFGNFLFEKGKFMILLILSKGFGSFSSFGFIESNCVDEKLDQYFSSKI